MKKNAVFLRKLLLPRARTLILFILPAVTFLLPFPLFDHLFWRVASLSLALYVLLSLFLRLPHLYRSARDTLLRRGYQKREWWTRATLFGGILFNLLYALFRLFAGVVTDSLWFCAEAIYYVTLSSIRFSLVEEDRRIMAEKDPVRRDIAIYRSYRKGGRLLLLLALAVYGIVFLAIRENRTYVYPNFIIIGAVLFAIWRAGSAIYNLLHFRRQKSPVLLSAKALSLSAALLSLFALQGTLLARFGRSLAWRAAWNGISGTFIGVLLTVMALMILSKGKSKAKKSPPKP